MRRVPVELGYPEWNAAAASPMWGGMQGPEGVAIEMQDTNYGASEASRGINREGMPPTQVSCFAKVARPWFQGNSAIATQQPL